MKTQAFHLRRHSELTRRRMVRILSSGLAVGLSGCRTSDSNWAVDLRRSADSQDLGILSLSDLDYGTRVDLLGYTIAGASAGKIALPEKPSAVAVCPEGDWIGWCNLSAFAAPVGEGKTLRVTLVHASEPARSFAFDSWSGGPLGLSANANRVALVTSDARTNLSRKLLVLSGTTGHVEQDLTNVATRFPLGEAIRIDMSASGSRLVLGSTESFIVIDLSSSAAVYHGRGLFCSLSPDGHFVAFLNSERRISVVALEDQRERMLLGSWTRVSGVGAWSPDSQYLLAGVAGFVSKTLFAVDVKANRATGLMPLGDLAGDRCVWIKKGLLT